MVKFSIWTVLGIASVVVGQQLGPTPEIHPDLTTQTCTVNEGCIPRATQVVLDWQWRNIVDVYNGDSCITASGMLNKTICPDAEECARKCALDGANYLTTGVETHGDSVTLHMYRRYRGKLITVQPQIYLLLGGDYAVLSLLNQEVSFDTDASNLPCGMDGAAYLVGMDPTGGRSRLNPAGANYGTGYCDSQCDLGYNFINGVANINGSGGLCCPEMDLWEANARSTQLTVHPCDSTGPHACSGDDCELGNFGHCARTGCDFNPYGLGNHQFYGLRRAVDTNKPFKVVTQFLTHDGTRDGKLSEIRRFYVQNGKIIKNAAIDANGKTFDSMTSEFCEATSPNLYLNHEHGGLAQMGEALKRGMVLVMGLWSDPTDFNRWLDSGSAGPCNRSEGSPASIKKNHPSTSLTFSNIRWGDIGSTFKE